MLQCQGRVAARKTRRFDFLYQGQLIGQLAERYELGPTGFPSAYYAVSFAPVDWVTKDPRLDVRRRPDVWSFATKRAIQQQLKAEGLYEGPAIGWMNVATRRAIDGIAQN